MQRRKNTKPSHGHAGGVLAPVLTPLIGAGGTVTENVVPTVSVPLPTIGNSPPPSDGGTSQNSGGGGGTEPSGGGTGQTPPPASGGGQSPPAPLGGGQLSNGSSGQESPPLAGATPGGVTPPATGGGVVPTPVAGVTANGNPTNSAESIALPTAGNANNLISSAGYQPGASPSDTGEIGSSNNPGDSTGQADSPQNTNGAGERHSLTSGATAGIVLSALLASVLVVLLILRRRANSRRNARRKSWFVNGRFEKPDEEPYAEKHPDARVVSVRSSFGTNFDHVLNLENMELFEDESQTRLPSLAVNAMPSGPLRVSIPPTAHLLSETSHRNSAGSIKSDEGQTLSIPQDLADQDRLYFPSISVRPFSPSESFAFPKPPPGDSDPEVPQRIYSPEINLSSNRGSFTTKHSSLSPTTPTGSRNPFVEPQVIREEMNDSDLWPQFGHVETIRRPFHPTLDDELLVAPGDAVRIVKPYDDGWALVEQMKSDGGKPQGHIPIDCLRNSCQEVPAYVASSRTSSQNIGRIPNVAAIFGMAM